MTRNIGKPDRILRLAGAALLILLALGAAGIWAWLAVIAAVILAATALAGTCPIYSLTGISTCEVRK